jgi:DNA-binding transcriptional MerR regulator
LNPTESNGQLRIGKLAAQAGVGVQTLHYYERLGLLPRTERSSSNYRLYSPDVLRRVQFIKKAQAVGFTLEEIKQIFTFQKRGAVRCRGVAELGEKRLRELDAQLEMLQAFRRSLAAALPKWKKQTASWRNCAGEFCDLIEGLPRVHSKTKQPHYKTQGQPTGNINISAKRLRQWTH